MGETRGVPRLCATPDPSDKPFNSKKPFTVTADDDSLDLTGQAGGFWDPFHLLQFIVFSVKEHRWKEVRKRSTIIKAMLSCVVLQSCACAVCSPEKELQMHRS